MAYLPLSVILVFIFTEGVWGFKLFSAIHLLIYGAIFYWMAKVISKGLALLSQTWKLVGFASISTALVAIAFLPVYGFGHHEYHPVNLHRLIHSLFGFGF